MKKKLLALLLGLTLCLSLAACGSDAAETVTLTVADTGCGIPPEELPRITEPFYMVDKSRARRQGGSGLGLALCRRIAAAHGSALQIESEPGKGTRVSVTLPVWREVQS